MDGKGNTPSRFLIYESARRTSFGDINMTDIFLWRHSDTEWPKRDFIFLHFQIVARHVLCASVCIASTKRNPINAHTVFFRSLTIFTKGTIRLERWPTSWPVERDDLWKVGERNGKKRHLMTRSRTHRKIRKQQHNFLAKLFCNSVGRVFSYRTRCRSLATVFRDNLTGCPVRVRDFNPVRVDFSVNAV